MASSTLFGQSMEVWHPNYTSFSDYTPNISQELIKLSNPSDYTHPEFGVLPENSPCDDCIELIGKRTLNSRYFVRNGSNGNVMYTQAAFGNLHYIDSTGRLISLDRRLVEESPNRYVANHQLTPTVLDVAEKHAGFIVHGQEFNFSNEVRLFNKLNDGTLVDWGVADWSDYTIGDNGIYIHNAWNNIDMQISFDLNMIKTSYIVQGSIPISEGSLVISDHLLLPDNFVLWKDTGIEGEYGWNGTLLVGSAVALDEGFEIGRAVAYDSKDLSNRDSIGNHALNPEYHFDSLLNILDMYVPATWFADTSLIYPLTIDPLVTSSATYGSQIKYRYNGEFCAGVNYCGYTLDVPLPSNCTVTGATFSAQQITVAGACYPPFACYMSDAGFRFWSDSCGVFNPTGGYFWGCNFAGIGTCTATNFDISNLVDCLTPKCNGSIPFEMRTSYCFCNTNGTNCATAGLPCQRMNANTWSVTISGHNLETLGDLTTGNGSITYYDTYCCENFVLDPAPQYGVPPYTYLWGGFGGGGSTAPDTTVFSCSNGTYVYTCTVTDACNVSRTATFTLVADDCLLPISLTNFEGEWNGRYVALKWQTESEINSNYFEIERSANGSFLPIGIVQGQGQSAEEHFYSALDENFSLGQNYYRLKLVDNDGNFTYSNTISVQVGESMGAPYPNPATSDLFFLANDIKSG
ncbi:MAG: hypothetical protein R2794_10735, partial [Chitinophagales bacterium]